MKIQDAILVLEEYQAWRKGADTVMLHPRIVSEALNLAIKVLKETKNT
jgi:hypothetical protein